MLQNRPDQPQLIAMSTKGNPVSYSRTFTAASSGPVRFVVNGDFVAANVEVGRVSRAEAVLTTGDDRDGPAAEAIDKARFSPHTPELNMPLNSGSSGGVTVVSSGDNYISVSQNSVVVDGEMTGVVMTGSGSMYVSGGEVWVNGVKVQPGKGGGKVSTGIKLTLRLPSGSSLKTNGKNGNYVVTGEQLEEVDFKNYNGSLDVQVPVEALEFDAYNGDLHATKRVGEVNADSYNGSLRVDYLHGNGHFSTYNGSIDVSCHAPGRVSGKSYNGNVNIVDAARLGDSLKVKSTTRNGRRYGRTS